uniref:Uncharacterized protein n=1 Tax=uncultured marine virus TaxID=186617 RepID=A0A0F7L387_9VIRU|nr:hypothetical protein [uncultured marine virus]
MNIGSTARRRKMRRIRATCSCGAYTWSETYDDGKKGFSSFDGIAADCPECQNWDKKHKVGKVEKKTKFRRSA